MLLFHTVAQVGVQLRDLILALLEELVVFDVREVLVELLNSDYLCQLRIYSHLFELRLSQLTLKVVVLFLQLVLIHSLLLEFLIAQS